MILTPEPTLVVIARDQESVVTMATAIRALIDKVEQEGLGPTVPLKKWTGTKPSGMLIFGKPVILSDDVPEDTLYLEWLLLD